MSYRVVCTKGNITRIVFVCDTFEEAKSLVMGNMNEIISDYYDLKRKYRETHNYNLIKGIIYDKEAILELLEWEIYGET